MNALDMLRNIGSQFPGVGSFVLALFSVMGLIFVGFGLKGAAFAGRPGSRLSVTGGILMALVGSVMASTSGWVRITSETTMSQAAAPADILLYQTPAGASPIAVVLSVSIGAINLIGYVGILMGSYHMAHLGRTDGSSKKTFWDAGIYLVGGTMAANFLPLLDVLANSLGVTNEVRVLLSGVS